MPEPLSRSELVHVDHLIEEIIFIPFLNFDHFGHLLTETIAWLSPILNASEAEKIPKKILLGKFAFTSKALLRRLFPAMEVMSTSDLKMITLLEMAWVPRPSMVNRDKITKRHFKAVANYFALAHGIDVKNDLTPRVRQSRIYFSRSRLPVANRKIVNESLFEQLLLKQGWIVVHPQELTMKGQLEIIQGASVVMGALGSAFHLLMALGLNVRLPRVITFGFPNELERPGPGMNFGLQFKKQSLNYVHLDCLEPSDLSLGIDNIPRSQNLRFTLSLDDLLDSVNNILSS